MQTWRCANIDNVDIRPATDFIKAPGCLLYSVFFGHGDSALKVNVADHFDLKQVREFLKAFDMFDADSGADNRDSERVTHR
jgi:hypothetical protein